jgi:cardiolipin synthase
MEALFLVLAITGVGLLVLIALLAFFEPGLEYRITEPAQNGNWAPLDSAEFARVLSALTDALPHGDTCIEVLTNGENFYQAELAAIGSARSHICLEAYIFQKGEIGSRFIRALAERARAGVEVMVVLDALGSFNTWRHTFREITAAGGRVYWYVPFRWYNVARYNYRTHRELLVVDSRIGFVGGAGIADVWYRGKGRNRKERRPWRDTMFRVEGRAVASLQAMFAENWLEASGELLAAPHYYPDRVPEDRTLPTATALVINSTHSHGRATRARMLFQLLIASAQRSIHVTTPYFVPDRSARRALIQALECRGVEVKILVPGKHADHLLTRRSSRRLYGELLRHGVVIYEYQPSMIHTKSLVVDGAWSVVGSTNFDSRSFGLNDELNVAALDESLAARLELDFQADLAHSRRVTYRDWLRRPALERFHEWLGWIVERQQ